MTAFADKADFKTDYKILRILIYAPYLERELHKKRKSENIIHIKICGNLNCLRLPAEGRFKNKYCAKKYMNLRDKVLKGAQDALYYKENRLNFH